jgi:hydrogenase expression/formation protein HypC
MCLADLGPVVAKDESGFATVELAGAHRRVSLAPLVIEGREPAVGDWVIVHTGLAIEVLEPDAAMEIVQARAEMEQPPEQRTDESSRPSSGRNGGVG